MFTVVVLILQNSFDMCAWNFVWLFVVEYVYACNEKKKSLCA